MLLLPLAACVLLQGVGPPAHPPGPASGERLGNASLVTRALPAKLRAEHPFAGVVREGVHFGYRIAFPKGSCRLRLGFAELVHDRPGERRFDVVVNGETRIDDLDLVAAAGPAPSVHVVELDVRARRRGVAVWLHAEEGRATLAWLEVTDGKRRVLVDCGGFGEPLSRAEKAPLGEVLLARFGSRFLVDLQPQWGRALFAPRGLFTGRVEPLVLGLEVEGEVRRLPFCGEGFGSPFDAVEERRGPGGVTYRVRAGGLEAEIALDAPFDPADRGLSGLPAVLVRFRRLAGGVPARAVLRLPSVRGEARDSEGPPGVVRSEEDGELGLFPADTGARFELEPFGVDLPLPREGEARLVVAARARGLELDVFGDPMRPVDVERFDTVEDVAREALARIDDLLAARRRIDRLLEGAGPPALARLFAHALPSYLANTWWVGDESGARFYSCQEGRCRFHSTLDVEAHQVAFYDAFAPDLLRGLLEAWPRTLRGEGHLAHDLGLAAIGEPGYGHEMPVEENLNYVLLLHAYAARSADAAFARERADLVRRLLDAVLESDEDADGFPDRGVANTFDDARPVAQFARGQTYLALKGHAGFLAGARLLALAGNDEDARRFREAARRILETLDERAWRGDHYAVTIRPDAEGLVDPWGFLNDGRPWPAGARFEGADDASSLTALGLLPWLRVRPAAALPLARLRRDLRTAATRCERRFGLAHTEGEDAVWVSQNLVFAAVAARLGLDLSAFLPRAVEFEESRARERDLPFFAGFCDSPTNVHLSYYPRGLAVLLVVEALAGFRLDRIAGRADARPLRAPLAVPLLALADWPTGRVPVLAVDLDEQGRPRVSLTHPELLEGLEGGVDLSLLGGAFVPWREVGEPEDPKGS